jgi:hypothetical protein
VRVARLFICAGLGPGKGLGAFVGSAMARALVPERQFLTVPSSTEYSKKERGD